MESLGGQPHGIETSYARDRHFPGVMTGGLRIRDGQIREVDQLRLPYGALAPKPSGSCNFGMNLRLRR